MRKIFVLTVVTAVMVMVPRVLPNGTTEASQTDPYADSVVAVSGTFKPGTSAVPLSGDPAVAAPLVLGAPDAPPSTSAFIQISDDSSITLAFGDNVAHSDGSPSGVDLRVHTFDTGSPAAAIIEASADGVTFVALIPPPLNDPGRACLGDPSQSCNYDDNAAGFIDLDFDSAGLSLVTQVRLTDLPGGIDGDFTSPGGVGEGLVGFDLDAVEALNSAPPSVGGIAAIVSDSETPAEATRGSDPSAALWAAIAGAAAAALALVAGGWYARRRWLR